MSDSARCSFRDCDPSAIDGCPCELVKLNGGPLQAEQVADVMGVPLKAIRSVEFCAMQKLRNLPVRSKNELRTLLQDFMPARETSWDAADKQAGALSVTEARAMLTTLKRKWEEFGWK